MTVSVYVRRVAFGVLGMALAATPAVVPATPVALAACNDVVDTTDSFSMNCVPTVIPDVSDQLTEAEVAQPGWNAVPGGGSPGTGGRR